MGGGGDILKYSKVGGRTPFVLLVSPLCEPIAQQVPIYGMTYTSGPW